jgi:hypothetical protein
VQFFATKDRKRKVDRQTVEKKAAFRQQHKEQCKEQIRLWKEN